jgi:hypothetical protein
MSCQEAEPLLDLYAIDACAAEQAEALSAHLADCPRCRAGLAQARELVVLLDWNAREPAARQRLHGRIEAEARRSRQRPRRMVVPLWVRQVGSLAALVLLTIGLTGWLDREGTGAAGQDLVLERFDVGLVDRALAPQPAVNPAREMKVDIAPEAAHRGGNKKFPGSLALPKSSLIVAGSTPEIHLKLALTNTSDRLLLIRTDGPDTFLQIGLQGPGVRQRPLHGPVREPPLSPRSLVLQAGATGHITLHRLEAGMSGEWTELAWTAPGDYTLTVRLRVEAIYPATARQAEQRGTMWLMAPAVRVHVLP